MSEAHRAGLALLRRSRSETSVEQEFAVRKIGSKKTLVDASSDSQMSSSEPSLFPPPFQREAGAKAPALTPRVPAVMDEKGAWENVGDTSSLGDLPPISSKQMGTIAILALASFYSTVMISSIAPFFPGEAIDMGVSQSSIALIFGIFELFVFILTPMCQKYLIWIGSKNMFVIGVLVEGTATVCLGFAKSLPKGFWFVIGCFAGRTFQAIGDAAFFGSSVAIIANEFPERIGTMVALVETFIGLGVTMGPPLSGALYQIGGFHLPFLVNGASLILIGSAGAVFVSWQEDIAAPRVGRIRDILMIPQIFLMSVAVVSGVACINFLDPTLQLHLKEFHLPPFFVGLMFLAVSGVYTTAAPLWRYLTDRYWLNWEVMMLGVFFTVIAMFFIGPTPFRALDKSVLSVGLCEALLGMGVSAVYVPAFENALEILRRHNYPDSFGTYTLVSGLFQSSFSLGGFVGPTFGGVLAGQIGFSLTATVFSGLNLLVLLFLTFYFIYNWVQRKPRRAESQDLIEIMNDSALISDIGKFGKPPSGGDLSNFYD